VLLKVKLPRRHCGAKKKEVWGAFVKLRGATFSYVASLLPTVSMEQLGFRWTDFHGILDMNIFEKLVEKIPVSLQSANNNRYFTCRPIYSFDHISLSS
jgi:hypothetical protein